MQYVSSSNVTVKNEPATNYGHCRCCLEEGEHRDITKVYIENGKREVYSDIFLDCFNLFISPHMNLSTLICNLCVNQLRQAHSFKVQVSKTEQQLIEALEKCNGEQMVLVNVPVPENTLDTTIGFKIEVNDPDDLRLKYVTEVCDLQDVSYEVLEETATEDTYENQETINEDTQKNVIYLTEKMALFSNTCALLEHSNTTIFKSKSRSGFPCFYCKEIFENFQVLRAHQNADHTRASLKKVLKRYSAESLVVYADVSDLKCLICDSALANLKELKTHLINSHKKIFYPKFTDRVVPFKLLENNYFQCQCCAFNFETFGAIERHMNTHYRNYVCSECGSGFVTMLRLKTHIHAIHREGTFPCEYCDKVFKTHLRYKGHIDFMHKRFKKLKCPKCPARFSDYFVQRKHLVQEHGETPILYNCNVCGRAFNRRYTLSCHMKRHLEQKDVSCDLCPYACYSKTELKEHMLKHNRDVNERLFTCSICNKSYSRRKTWKDHMRMHSGRRFVCQICDQTFLHIYSLRMHVRNDHTDFAFE